MRRSACRTAPPSRRRYGRGYSRGRDGGGRRSPSRDVSASGGLLQHNRGSAGDPGVASDFDWNSSTAGVQTLAASTTVIAFPVAWAITDRRTATAFTTGMISTYAAYEILHRRIHTHPPANAYGRWMRRSHLYHHFGGKAELFTALVSANTRPAKRRGAGRTKFPASSGSANR